ncbi:receptor-like protein kinase [Sesamum indicum]|uniref:non-specific serine/threonine protein kinase n=1 Tax=Sesamum indicum TaxID=4182 RepID=A0A6I9SY91_SESIN|nr:receptor-like protein kinase [Sesamum indicum]
MFLRFLKCVVLFVNLLAISSASQPQAASQLLQFRDSLPEASRLLLQWNQTSSHSDHCHWPGVSCYSPKDFRVRSLNLSSFGLSGVLGRSISNLCRLPDLVSLDLSGNNFAGTVPALLGNCSRLARILLNDNGFSGPIPPELFKSRRLQQLDLGYNLLSGAIPPEVGKCDSLEYLGLYNNLLSGDIPSELFSLSNLKFLYLSRNNLTGTLPNLPSPCLLSDLQIHKNLFRGSLPMSLSSCHNLTILYAYGNNLEGEIPNSFWGLRNLQELVLTENRFNGSLPEDLSRCTQLTYLDLSGNKLTGHIPKSVGSLINLEYLYLYNNMFNGFIPPETGNLSSLIEIRLQHNQISGIIPTEICSLQSLKVLHAFNNQIEGPIPHCIERLASLEELALYNNKLTGRIPSGVSNLTNLTFLSLAHNNLTGEVPSDLGKNGVPGMVKVDLTGNHLTGQIPTGICSGNSLSVLTLGNNLFTGSFPTEIIKCKSLTRVILKNNLLHGSIPDDMENRSSISYFDIRGNALEGKIPSVFGFWSNLSMIDLSENKFSGLIPQEFGQLQSLEVLRISSNRLTGEIPPELARCPRITELDLSKNELSGGIPVEVVSSLTLKIIRLQDNKMTGVVPNSFSNSQSLHELQLGNNMLEGTIPCSLSKVEHFSSLLNLSMNQLSGEIPKCLGILDKLEILDISSNNFSGEIPSETNNMASLSFVNISFNHLRGQIPAVWAKILDLHPGSTLGNPRLCLITTKSSSCESHKKSRTRGLILAGIITISTLLMACLLALVYSLVARIWHPQPSSPHQSLLYHRSVAEDLPEDLSFQDILRATEGWSDKYVIGRGKHGTVYRTESVKSRKHWAVKKVGISETKFSSEMRTLSLVRHRNVLRMGGYSIRNGYGFIVTEYMPEGTLYYLLHQRRPQVALNWETRYRIALGIAQGLSYLHHDCVPQIIHRDIKSDNILLDSDLEPKIADFGAAKMEPDSDESPTVSAIVGTLGYIAPENAYSTRLTDKSDVYSYGVILLELLCRKLPVDPSFGEGLDIISWVRKVVHGYNDYFCCLDEEIQYWEKEDLHEALQMMDLALQCTEMYPDNRPSMREVVGSLLKFNLQRKFSVRRETIQVCNT